ncbi:Leukotoxin export ATP-binding protein LtxB [BD1-7 clade bacterium]|uniref:Leukotoxin export ATP-binding protein LtxB n=1 Tax=BD1-7 clade bacterium TaxID=2029982 RepID=A0A5S9P4W6_9GAMM|nr:Leukotoxin export ATP-binding protein LtxB [BD1-7 clade bacterium]CAA0098194.1 Leukotoxin export ATP-binding protein LtxB [BD1-7 clade bacterium]
MSEKGGKLDFLLGGTTLKQLASKVWPEPFASWISGNHWEGDVQTVNRRDRFSFTSDTELVLVLSGFVDLFANPTPTDNTQQVPSFIGRFEAGSILFCPQASHLTVEQFAVSPSMDAQILKLDWHSIEDLTATEAFADCVEVWLTNLYSNLEYADENNTIYNAPRITLPLQSLIHAGQRVTANDFTWIKGLPAFAPTSVAPTLVPVSLTMAAVASEETTTPLSTKEWLSQTALVNHWQSLHHIIFDAYLKSAEERAANLEENNLRRAENVRAKYRNSLGRLPETLTGKDTTAPLHKNELVSAFLHLAKASSLDIDLEERQISVALRQDDPLGALAIVSSIQLRRINVRADLFQQNYPAILAFDRDGNPVTLVHHKTHHYQAIGSHHAQPNTHQLRSTAYVVVPELPVHLSTWNILRYAGKGLMPEARLVIACAFFAGLLSILPPLITGRIVGYAIPNAEVSQLVIYITALTGIGLTGILLQLIQNMSLLRTEGAMSFKLETAVWNRLLHLPGSFFQQYTAGDLANRAAGINQIRRRLGATTISGVLQGATGVFSLLMMLYYQWKIACIASLIALTYLVCIYFVGKRMLQMHRDLMLRQGHMQGLGIQLLNAISKLKTSNAVVTAFARWNRQYSDILALSYRTQMISNRLKLFKSLFHFLAFIGLITTVSFQGHVLFAFFETPTSWVELHSQNTTQIISTADFMAFNVALGQFMAAVFTLSESAVNLMSLKPDYERIRPILDQPTESENASEPVFSLAGNISINHVSFRYQDDLPLAVQNISIDITAGEYVAIVGFSGSGKSTLMRLLLGFEKPLLGSIQYDRTDLTALNKPSLRRQLGVVLQSRQLIDGSIRDNLRAGRNIDDKRLWQALDDAGLKPVIDAMPMKLETRVSANSTAISGGQVQRLMIARALAQNPKVLLFDEATSSLDNQTQAIITRALDQLQATRIVIAHRLSTIIKADRILVMQDGKIVEQGSYDALKRQNGHFTKLMKYQHE